MTWTRETATKAKSSSDLLSRTSHRPSHRRASAINLLANNSSEHSRSSSRIRTRGRDTEVGATSVPVEPRVRSRSRSSRPRHRSTTNLGGGTESSHNNANSINSANSTNSRNRRHVGHDEDPGDEALSVLNSNNIHHEPSSPPSPSSSFPLRQRQRGKGQDADGVIASESHLFRAPQNSPKHEEWTQDGSPSPRQPTLEQIDCLVVGVLAEAGVQADIETTPQQPLTPGTRRRHRETAPYAVAPLNDVPKESSFRVCRRTKSHDANTSAAMENPASPGSSRRRHRSKSRDAPPIQSTTPSLPRRSNSQDEPHAASQTASPGPRRHYRSKNRDLASLLPQGNQNEGQFMDGGSSSLVELRNNSTPTNARRRIKASQVPPPDGLDLFAATDTMLMVSPVASSVAQQETTYAVHDDFFATTPSSSRFILEEAEADGPSVATTQQQPQQMMTPARLKGFKHFLGSTTLIKKFHKGGHSPSMDDVMLRIGEIPKPLVVHPVEMPTPAPASAPAPLHENQPLVPGRKRNELLRNVFSPETRSRRGQQQHALTSKLMPTTNGASQLLSARRGGVGPGTFQSFDDSGVISSYLDVLHGDDCSIDQASPFDRKADNSREQSPTQRHQKSNSITETSLSSHFSGSTVNSRETPSDSVTFPTESNRAVRELEGLLSKPRRLEGLAPHVTNTPLQDLFKIDEGQGLGCMDDNKATTTTNNAKEQASKVRSETQLDLSQHSLMTLEEQKQFLQLNIPGILGSSASTLVVTQHDIFQETPTGT